MSPATRLPRRPPSAIPPEPEKQFMQAMIDLARALGWLASHTYDSRRSEEGFPDVVFVHPTWQRTIFAEFKSDHGRPTPAQLRWLTALGAAGQETYIWRPRDKEDVVLLLTRRAARKQLASAARNQEASL